VLEIIAAAPQLRAPDETRAFLDSCRAAPPRAWRNTERRRPDTLARPADFSQNGRIDSELRLAT
jgi:hypothetical protein